MCIKYSNPKIIFIVAFKAEIPHDWIRGFDVNIYSLSYIQKQDMSFIGKHIANKSILFLIIGKGKDNAEKAADWILNYFNPIAVINIGSCGLDNQRYPLGTLVIPSKICTLSSSAEVFIDNKLSPIPLDYNKIIYLSTKEPLYSVANIDLQTHLALKELKQSYLSVFVDMEGYYLASKFSSSNICFMVIKYVTDYIDLEIYDDLSIKNVLVNNLRSIRLSLQQDIFGFLNVQKNDLISISVIIPTYNRRDFIIKAIESVLKQSFLPKEIIIVDDGSADNTSTVIKDIFKDKIQLIRLDKNYGVSYARNIGVQHCSGEFIAFLDSDDLWITTKLKNQIQYLKNNPFFQILQSEEIWIRNNKRINPCKHHKKKEGWIWDISLLRCMISPSSVLMTKALFLKFGGFNSSFVVCEDYDLWLKITRYYPVGLESTKSLIKHGGHPDQLSSSVEAMDKYRVSTLLDLLQNEYDIKRMYSIFEIFEQKIQILITGAQKRNKAEDIKNYLNLYQKAREIYESKHTPSFVK